eukprot:CAMPEP_0179143614 /NCGR_PEP_ID=MMETSP0796-20121207/69100_1 /TAXON_ID=73915 /ORGANISM="Pyrodinium bahamense, Strain pbaha01" /LENGTH=37 /DNA_ID= /DNA_START= /DNA_END= /DNA_ORIENTATION=
MTMKLVKGQVDASCLSQREELGNSREEAMQCDLLCLL